ncbi:hypothetical protein ASG12_07595 [Williamsia sp. Leaf354]|uniref:hypothetical protein n=1 Tax=Williamsia sp. Leaf354 TaxID=1736349 RepID=UPI00071329FB|nr:hypothetical protein [Williamsia sp. Leaf354]KQS00717.1 hypothetical protein ASG12_07595 [Williamsia sp. Leaf354]
MDDSSGGGGRSFRWTRHRSSALTGRAIVLLTVPVAVFLMVMPALDGAWYVVTLGLFVLMITPQMVMGPTLRTVPDGDRVRVLPQPFFRNPRAWIAVNLVVCGAFLLFWALISDPVDRGYLYGATAFIAVGALTAVFAVRWQGELVIGQKRIDVAPKMTFSVDDDEVVIRQLPRTEAVVTLKHRTPGEKRATNEMNYRLWGIHPNTLMSLIEQLRQWNSQGIEVDGRTIAEMAAVPDQTSLQQGESVEIVLDVA